MKPTTTVRTEAEYEAALAEAKRLWGTAAETAESDRLDALATSIDVYEEIHFPIGANRNYRPRKPRATR